MTKNPFINAGVASLYIFLIAGGMNFASRYAKPDDSFFAPIVFLSLFTLSAGFMGYVFLSQPIIMFLSGEKKQGITLFVQTLGTFGVITVVLTALVFSGVI